MCVEAKLMSNHDRSLCYAVLAMSRHDLTDLEYLTLFKIMLTTNKAPLDREAINPLKINRYITQVTLRGALEVGIVVDLSVILSKVPKNLIDYYELNSFRGEIWRSCILAGYKGGWSLSRDQKLF